MQKLTIQSPPKAAELLGHWTLLSIVSNERNKGEPYGVATLVLLNGALYEAMAEGKLSREHAHEVAHVILNQTRRTGSLMYTVLAKGMGQDGSKLVVPDISGTGAESYDEAAECDGPPDNAADQLRRLLPGLGLDSEPYQGPEMSD